MTTPFRRRALLCLALAALSSAAGAASLPAKDERAKAPATLNTLRQFPEIKNKAAWDKRAREIRERALISCGLWPLPPKTPLNARVFDRVERDGYSIEKVYFQTYPGFYLSGNLYRPLGKGKGPFPAILNPHGHWSNGRMADTADGSIAARCISFARQGMIAFSYDMAGYNDTAQVTHKFGNQPAHELWNISLMGLQTWNSIRALDFLESLEDADSKRLACTGESGGGTQTFMLGAIDNRLAALGPIVMVSHSMQGGCLCENAPGLRVDYSNMEFAAAAAPRPQILVAATGDWTRATMKVEGPAIASVYALLKKPDQLRYAIFDYGHNYNQTSREAVYEAFGKWLKPKPAPASWAEAPYQKEPDAALRVFPDGKLPADALNEEQLTQSLITLAKSQIESLLPLDGGDLGNFRWVVEPVWRHSLQLDYPVRSVAMESHPSGAYPAYVVGRPGKGDRIAATLLNPAERTEKTVVILAHPEGQSAYQDARGKIGGLANTLLQNGFSVLMPDLFLTGGQANPEAQKARNHHTNFFSTYNRTDLQERVQDLITLAAFARKELKAQRVILCGESRAGLWSLLAAPAADAVVADCDQLDTSNDAALLNPDLFSPGLQKFGGFTAAAILAAPHPVLIHNTGAAFATQPLERSYAGARTKNNLRKEPSRLDGSGIAQWLKTQKSLGGASGSSR